MKRNNRKKKGFTLVELIAVIAILAILAALVVPRVGNYSAKATNARNLANEQSIISAVELYNADHETNPITDDTILVATSGNDCVKSLIVPEYLSAWPTNIGMTVTVGTTTYKNLLTDIQTKQ